MAPITAAARGAIAATICSRMICGSAGLDTRICAEDCDALPVKIGRLDAQHRGGPLEQQLSLHNPL